MVGELGELHHPHAILELTVLNPTRKSGDAL
jgi:hypothetical protein